MATHSESGLPRWNTLEEERMFRTRIFDLDRVRRREEETGREGEFYVLRSNDWINVMAVTTENELVLVEQFRHGTDAFELEIVGGLVDPGESPKDTAIRELREETGYEPTETSIVELLGVVLPNPAFLDNRCHLFLVTNVRRSSKQSFDEHENIVVHLAPLETMDDLVRSGKITHSLVIAAFYFYGLLFGTRK